MAKKRTPEGEVKNSICEWLELNALCEELYVINSVAIYDPVNKCFRRPAKYFKPGMPDIFVWWDGRPVWIEAKAPKGRLSPEQKEFIDISNKNGVLAFVARSIEDCEKHLLQVPTSDLEVG